MRMRLIAFVLFIALIFAICCTSSYAEEDYTMAWVLCQPDSWVNSRRFPKKDGEVNARLFPGDKILLDGKQKHGFMHAVGIASEDGDGWVSEGFIVYSEPNQDGHDHLVKAKGRVACRRSIGGTRRHWLRDGDILTVYLISDEWCLTNEGFVKTEFIDLESRVDIGESTNPDDMTWENDIDE